MLGEKPSFRTKLQVLKVRPGSTVEVVVVSPKALTCHVHWLGSRSYMCPGHDCAACFAGVGARWHAFLGVRWSLKSGKTKPLGLIELTQSAFERLEGLRKMFELDSLFGLHVTLERRSKKSGLRAEPLIVPDDAERPKKPLPWWMLVDAVATLYGLPSCPSDEHAANWEKDAIPQAARMIRSALPRAVNDDRHADRLA